MNLKGKRYLFLGLLLLALGAYLLMTIPSSKSNVGRPGFTKEGELTIYRSATQEAVAQLDIEIADDQESIVRGLMYRQEMEENQGMLFIMPAVEPQSFWMLNTYIPLDILFIGADRRVVSIAENTKPQSIDPVPSEGDAGYVLEVNAGFVQRKGVLVGDRLEW